MKNTVLLLVVAVLLTLAGFGLVSVSRVERHMADAQQSMSTFQYPAASENLDAAEEYLGYGRLTSLGADTAAEIRARRAALQYWQQEYGALLPAQGEPVAAVDETNVELQLVVANAAYRVGRTKWEDRDSTLQALDEAAGSYLTVLKNTTWHPDAAFNYEYIVRLRNDIAKGRKPLPERPSTDLGEAGDPAPDTKLGGFQIYVPLQSGERAPSGGEAGQGAPRPRKG
jgi:hypothetical protein